MFSQGECEINPIKAEIHMLLLRLTVEKKVKFDEEKSIILLNLWDLLSSIKEEKFNTMWKEQNDQLVRAYQFENFNEAFGFMTRAAMIIEQHNHHPEWTNVYNRLEIRLRTHDAGNTVTDKDRDLAEALEALYQKK